MVDKVFGWHFEPDKSGWDCWLHFKGSDGAAFSAKVDKNLVEMLAKDFAELSAKLENLRRA